MLTINQSLVTIR